jgi:hypothetical protein
MALPVGPLVLVDPRLLPMPRSVRTGRSVPSALSPLVTVPDGGST